MSPLNGRQFVVIAAGGGKNGHAVQRCLRGIRARLTAAVMAHPNVSASSGLPSAPTRHP